MRWLKRDKKPFPRPNDTVKLKHNKTGDAIEGRIKKYIPNEIILGVCISAKDWHFELGDED